MSRRPNKDCPVEATLDVLSGKWKANILFQLHSGTKRFGELRRLIPKVTQQMLTAHLRDLERSGIIRRRVYANVPPQVEYSLAPLGRKLAPVFDAMYAWGLGYLKAVRGPATSKHGD
jgi:DNA-binding HxlR family transcriptional regulator